MRVFDDIVGNIGPLKGSWCLAPHCASSIVVAIPGKEITNKTLFTAGISGCYSVSRCTIENMLETVCSVPWLRYKKGQQLNTLSHECVCFRGDIQCSTVWTHRHWHA